MGVDKKRVLIVDDAADDIQFVMENLKEEYAVLVATSGIKGFELAAKDPQPSATDLCWPLRMHPHSPALPSAP